MQRIAVFVWLNLITFLGVGGQAATSLEGWWEGAYVRDGAVQLTRVLFQTAADSTLIGRYEIPELGLYEQPLQEVGLSDTLVRFRTIYGLQNMRIQEGFAQLTGGSTDWTPPLQLHLKPARTVPVVSYSSKDLLMTGTAGRIEGTLYTPDSGGPFATVVIVHGEEQQTRQDWTYRSWAYLLAQNGIAAFVFDKRGFGNSGGTYSTATYHDLAADVQTVVQGLRNNPDVRPGRIGLLGVSQGGWVTAIAARQSPYINYAVFFESPAVSTWEQERQRVEYTLRADGFSSYQIDSAVAFTRFYFDVIAGKKDFGDLADISRDVQASRWWGYVQHPRSPNDPEIVRWRAINYDPADDLSHLRCPVLAIYGDADPVVPPAGNAGQMENLLRAAGVPREFITVPHLRSSITTVAQLSDSTGVWPGTFWVWSYRPHELDDRIPKWILKQAK